ncbi:hypothetical protein SEA_MASK_74 [Mycobacterium phage Mask]|nr:hypothetical protein SEA_MASK_74 [Mycobacterium phage Mask]
MGTSTTTSTTETTTHTGEPLSDHTGIEWTDATWNPATGCTKVSAGCDNCYAEKIAHRFAGTSAYPNGFEVTLRPERLDWPLRKRKPLRIFVNSMSDLFHDQVPDEYIAKVFAVMAAARHHTFQVLTKRHGRMRSLLSSEAFRDGVAEYAQQHADPTRGGSIPTGPWDGPEWWPLWNVWLGVSTENQKWADVRIPALLDTPAAVRFISAEPLLGPIDLLGDTENPGPAIVRTGVQLHPDGPWGPAEYDHDDQIGIDWVITGGESGPGARPAHPQWFRSLRDQCQAAGVAFLHKQHGEWIEDVTEYPANPECGIDEPYRVLNVPRDAKDRKRCALHLCGSTALTPDNPFNPFTAGHGGWTAMRRVGKKHAGRELDGRTWDEYPEVTR